MASTLNASTSGGGGIIATADASGVMGLQTAGTTAVTIDASQNVGIGTSSPATKLQVAGQLSVQGGDASIQTRGGNSWLIVSSNQGYGSAGMHLKLDNTSGAAAMFIDNTTERMRIDSSGNVLVGTTTSGGAGGLSLQPSATTPGLAMVGSGTSGGAGFNLYSTGTSNYRFYVDWGGVIHAISTSISAISDATVKENVRDLETGLKEVMKLQPRRFDFINGDGKDVAGFIAQEVEKVLPDLVSDSPYSKDEEGNDIYKKNLKMGDMLPTLVKAIQEQQELIKQLQADVAALKGATA